MRQVTRTLVSNLVGISLGSTVLLGQQVRAPVHGLAPAGSAFNCSRTLPPTALNGGGGFTPLVNSYLYPTFGWYGGYASPFLYLPSLPPPHPIAPNYWWTGMYPIADPRQDGYNPSSGYPQGTVTTLLLVAFPEKARVTLDGIFIGTSDTLGPIQLPAGEHSLRVEAPAYEPSETILKVEQPIVQQLEVRLNPMTASAKPGPRT